VQLLHAALDGRRVFACTQCHGVLANMEVFVAAVDSLCGVFGHPSTPVARPQPKELRRRIQCPNCHARMDTHVYGGPGNIVIDSCSRCHLNWLDYGELRRVIRGADCSRNDQLL
jgi:hypothetical protein